MQNFRATANLADVSDAPERYDVAVEGYDDHFLIRRIVQPRQLDLPLSLVHNEPAGAGDYYYLRIRQSDGGLIWSSPFWVQ